MKKSLFAIGLLASVTLGAETATAQQVCGNLTGAARSNCLNQELARQQAETARINRQNRRIDQATRVTCAAQNVYPRVAGAVANKVVPGSGAAASATARASTVVGNAATGAKCP